MEQRLERAAIQQWLEQRSTRELALVFLAGAAVIYLLWNLIIELPLRHKREELQNQIQALQSELDTQRQQLYSIEHLISSSAFVQNVQKQKQLRGQAQQTGTQLQSLEQTFVPTGLLAQVTNDLIAQQEEVVLVSLRTFLGEPWLQDKTIHDSVLSLQNVYQHKMELEFRGTYFNTVAFLQHLEKLPWHFYWDRLDYQVSAYPEAKVSARFYVLSNQKD